MPLSVHASHCSLIHSAVRTPYGKLASGKLASTCYVDARSLAAEAATRDAQRCHNIPVLLTMRMCLNDMLLTLACKAKVQKWLEGPAHHQCAGQCWVGEDRQWVKCT